MRFNLPAMRETYARLAPLLANPEEGTDDAHDAELAGVERVRALADDIEIPESLAAIGAGDGLPRPHGARGGRQLYGGDEPRARRCRGYEADLSGVDVGFPADHGTQRRASSLIARAFSVPSITRFADGGLPLNFSLRQQW